MDSTADTILEMIKIIDTAISMERNAIMFFSSLAMKSDSASKKKLYKDLTDSERSHMRRLIDKRNEYAAHKSVDGIVGSIDYNEKMTEIRESFNPNDSMTDEEIVRDAIKNEMKAYAFYQKKISYTKDPSARKLLQDLANDEEEHARLLKEQLARM